MKSVLCFGDSITWGFNAATMKRFDFSSRWPGAMQHALGDDYHIIEEGHSGRTTVFDDALAPRQKMGAGVNVLPMLLDSHAPIDLIIIMLGTNDLQSHRNATARIAARGCAALIKLVYESVAGIDSAAPKILLVSPPPFVQTKGYMEIAFDSEVDESKKFSHYYKIIAETFKVHFLDAGSVVVSSHVDGIHLEADQEIKLGQAMAEKVKSILE